jgi:hypothetical protein
MHVHSAASDLKTRVSVWTVTNLHTGQFVQHVPTPEVLRVMSLLDQKVSSVVK